MHNPLHPGEIVADALFNDTNLSITEAARSLDIDRTTLSRLLNGHSGISPIMALKLSLFLGTSVEMWMNIQQDYDLWQLKKERHNLRIKPLKRILASSQTKKKAYA